MTRRIALILALAVALAGATVVPALGAGTLTNVKVGDNFFRPRAVHISKGATVKWTWIGMSEHNVTVTRGPTKFHSRTQVHGTFSHTFTGRGTWHLVCTIHGFTMTIQVS